MVGGWLILGFRLTVPNGTYPIIKHRIALTTTKYMPVIYIFIHRSGGPLKNGPAFTCAYINIKLKLILLNTELKPVRLIPDRGNQLSAIVWYNKLIKCVHTGVGRPVFTRTPAPVYEAKEARF